MTFSLLSSVILMFLKSLFPGITESVSNSIRSVNFYELLMNVFLGFILFAGAYKLFNKWLEKNNPTLLTWCALRGGISIALALSLHNNMYRSHFVIITYVIVVLTIIAQRLIIKKEIRRLGTAS